MSEDEIVQSLELEGNETNQEKAAKIIEWFLDTMWHETWCVEDSKPFGEYIRAFVADLRDSK